VNCYIRISVVILAFAPTGRRNVATGGAQRNPWNPGERRAARSVVCVSAPTGRRNVATGGAQRNPWKAARAAEEMCICPAPEGRRRVARRGNGSAEPVPLAGSDNSAAPPGRKDEHQSPERAVRRLSTGCAALHPRLQPAAPPGRKKETKAPGPRHPIYVPCMHLTASPQAWPAAAWASRRRRASATRRCARRSWNWRCPGPGTRASAARSRRRPTGRWWGLSS